MTPITLIPCLISPRVENIADFAAGLLAIQRHGIPQILHLHPEDIALVRELLDPPTPEDIAHVAQLLDPSKALPTTSLPETPAPTKRKHMPLEELLARQFRAKWLLQYEHSLFLTPQEDLSPLDLAYLAQTTPQTPAPTMHKHMTLDEIEQALPPDTNSRNLWDAYNTIRQLPGGPTSYGLARLALCLRRHRKAPIPEISEESIRQEAQHFLSRQAVS